jgi:hypothetical protein
MNWFSQLNGRIPLPHGKADAPLTDWSDCAFSQLNALQSCTFLLNGSPTPSLRPFSQLNASVPARCFTHRTKNSNAAFAVEGRVFSQLNAGGRPLLGQTQKDAFAEETFSQLNALGGMTSRAYSSAACPRVQSVRHRPGFRCLKRRAYLHTAYEPRSVRGSVHLEPEFGEIA